MLHLIYVVCIDVVCECNVVVHFLFRVVLQAGNTAEGNVCLRYYNEFVVDNGSRLVADGVHFFYLFTYAPLCTHCTQHTVFTVSVACLHATRTKYVLYITANMLVQLRPARRSFRSLQVDF